MRIYFPVQSEPKSSNWRKPSLSVFLGKDFIPVKGKGDVSAMTISRWIRMAILKAYENMTDRDPTFLNIRAHEIRVFSTSWAYHNRVPIEDILQAACWRNLSTFSSFYLRSLSSQEEGLFRLGPIVSAQRVIHQ